MPVLGFIPSAAFLPPIVGPSAAELLAGAGVAATAARFLPGPLKVVAGFSALALLLGATILDAGSAQAPGLQNSRPSPVKQLPQGFVTVATGTYTPTGTNRYSLNFTATRRSYVAHCEDGPTDFAWSYSYQPVYNAGKVAVYCGPKIVSRNVGSENYGGLCATVQHVQGYYWRDVKYNPDGSIDQGMLFNNDFPVDIHGWIDPGSFGCGVIQEAINGATPEQIPSFQQGPQGATVPTIAPTPAYVPVAPDPAVLPSVVPQTQPATQPSPTPQSPGVAPPVEVGTGVKVPLVPLPIPGSTGTTIDAKPKPKAPPKPAATPSTAHFPAGIPITSNPPQPTLQGIAQEVGRIEQKLNTMMQVPGTQLDTFGILAQLFDAFLNTFDQGQYTLEGPCEIDDQGDPVDSLRTYDWGGSFNAFENIGNRIDKLAEMLQYSKTLKQPICNKKATVSGELVSVNFVSLSTSPGGTKPLRKLMRYRDQTGADVTAHVQHWMDYTWEAGNVIVKNYGPDWGQVQVWAISAAAGKNVIRHAAAISGVNPDDAHHRWEVQYASAARYGQTGTMQVRRLGNGAYMVSKRIDSNGQPMYAVPTG